VLAKEFERVGLPTVIVTSLPDVAVQMGANRVLRPRASTFHHPFGVAQMDADHERIWRREAVLAALKVLQTPVDGPTVFDF
jgi:glycine/betaine/sarcosine/D-proline reductase family selenoprotein B